MKRRLDKEWLKNHLRYARWRYVMLVLLAIIGWDMLFTVTAYRVPPERKVDVYITGPYSSGELTDKLALDLRAALPEIEEINVYGVPLEGDDESIYYNEQLMTLRMGTGEGDLYLVTRTWMLEMAENGLLLPLDDAVAEGRLALPGDMSAGRFTLSRGERAGEEHQYAVPLAELYGFIENELYDNRYTFMVIPAYTKNPDGAVRVMQWLIDNRAAPKPDWLE